MEEYIEIPAFIEEESCDVVLNPQQNSKGITVTTTNGFLKRLWFLLSNPFRYIFTGKIKY